MTHLDGLYVGLLSGTSVDAIDAALVRTDGRAVALLGTRSHTMAPGLRSRLLTLAEADTFAPEELGTIDRELGMELAEAALALIAEFRVAPSEVVAIGSHGQTIRHRPARSGSQPGFTWQIGDPNTIAELTGICTVADFRRRDIAAGGQGAPLVPAFHDRVFRSHGTDRIVANIGGISNVSLLPGDPSGTVSGFDTGPGNALMDAWILRHLLRPYDHDGEWARSGRVCAPLLRRMLAHPYLDLPPPKSTGREEFNLQWLDALLADAQPLAPEDIQATLLHFTVESLAGSIESSMPGCKEVFLCGGGAANTALRCGLEDRLRGRRVGTTEALGIHPDWVEACAFAWLAHQSLSGLPGNLPAVTGALRPVCLGGVYPGSL